MTHRIAAWTLTAALVATASLVGASRQSAAPQQNASAERQLEAAIHREQVLGDVKGAIEQYKALAKGANRAVAAQALVRLGECYEKLGESQFKEARATYERVVREFGDQGEVVQRARVRLAALGRPRNAGEVVARLILRDSGEATGHLSADGKLLRRIDAPTGDLIEFDLASGQTRRVANTGGPEAKQPPLAGTVFSRNGKQVAYDTSQDGITSQLRIRNVDGSGCRTLYAETGIYAVAVDWSADGDSLLAIRINTMAKGQLELVLLTAADGAARVLARMPPSSVQYEGFEISPDGRHVAYSYVREGHPAQSDISVVTADGRDDVVVAAHPADDRLRAWTPDGRGLLFASDRSGGWDLWMVPIAAGKQHGEPQVVKKSFGDAELLGVTSNGSLYYQTKTALGRLFYGAVDLETGRVIDPPAPVATRYQMRVVDPAWSPDGQSLAYVSHPGDIGPGNNIVTIRSAATGEERFLSPRLLLMSRIGWAPDGLSIIARERKPDGTETVRIDTATSEFTRLRGDGTLPHLCPDGKTLVFLAPDAIRKQNLETGEQSEVVKVGKMSYDLSPDGQSVAYVANDAIKIVSLNGGEPRELYRGSAQSYGLEWTRDGRYIIALARNTKSSEIWRIPAKGGTALRLDLSVPNLDGFTLHPDNRRFAFTVTDGSRRELWMVENLLRPQPAAK